MSTTPKNASLTNLTGLYVLCLLALTACGRSDATSTAATPTLADIKSSKLSLEKVVLAQPSQNPSAQNLSAQDPGVPPKLTSVPDQKFTRGSQVYMVFINVAGLAKGADGKHKLDLNLQVQDPKGQMIYARQNLLGQTGHQNLPNNIIPAPYTAFTTSTTWPTGNYTVTMTLRDQVGQGYITARQVLSLQ